MDDFIAQFNGASLDFDHAAGSMCVDLAKAWLDHLGYDASGTWGDACNWDKNVGRQELIWIKNTTTGVPAKGDLVVWDTSIGKWGHIAVFVEGNASSFTSFDQNWPVGSVCHLQFHNYKGVKGWLRPKEENMEKDAIQFEGDTKVYFWAQNPEVAKAWYGSDWGKWVRLIKKPETIEVIKEVKVPYEVDSAATLRKLGELTDQVKTLEFEKDKLEGAIVGLNKDIAEAYQNYRASLDQKDLENLLLRQKLEEAGLSEEEQKVLSIWEKIKNFLHSLKRN